MADKLHAVTRLLLKRVESHPEEFLRSTNRWSGFLGDVFEWGSEADIAALNAALRDIRLGEVHEWVMDELLNGEQRRNEEERQREEQLKTLQQLSAGKAKAYPLTAQGNTIQKLSDMQRDTQEMLNKQLQGAYGKSWDQQLKSVLGNKK
jgi:hypothetical protein